MLLAANTIVTTVYDPKSYFYEQLIISVTLSCYDSGYSIVQLMCGLLMDPYVICHFSL